MIYSTKGSGYLRRKPFSNRWGKLKQVSLPNAIFENDVLALKAHSVAVLLVLYKFNKYRKLRQDAEYASVRLSQRELTRNTGYSKNTITKATSELEAKLFIKSVENRKKYGEFGVTEYILCDHSNGEPSAAARNALYVQGIPYFTVPLCIVTQHSAKWSLSQMTSSEFKLYLSVLYQANRVRSNEFVIKAAKLRGMSGLALPTFKNAMNGLEERGLVWLNGDDDLRVQLCDPFTGAPLEELTGVDEDDAANWQEQTDGHSRRLNLNSATPEQIETLVRSSLPSNARVDVHGNDIAISCPYHQPDNTPSCFIRLRKNGCFKCFGCGESGSLRTLLMQIAGISMGEVNQRVASATGVQAHFHAPDERAIAIYSYRDEHSRLVKQVLRYPKKVFKQRQPGKGGEWNWSVADLPPMLFNMDWLNLAGMVAIVEGEKDACTVTELHMNGNGGLVIGMTSGGAESWDASLAKHLRGKRVIVMPDADLSGWKFAEKVKASLDAERIEYRTVDFAGTGAKDVSEYMETHSTTDLAKRIGLDWVHPGGGYIETPAPTQEYLPFSAEFTGEITI